MRRRELIAGIGGVAVALPLAARAQQTERVRRIGFMRVGPPPAAFINGFLQGMREQGFVEQHHFLVSNSLYAVLKRKRERMDGGYEPQVTALTKNVGDGVQITIRDNGQGIVPEIRDKIFNPFFTTKPAGEGTGLGLSLSYDIIVKQHAGNIEFESEPGHHTEFRVTIPRSNDGRNRNASR